MAAWSGGRAARRDVSAELRAMRTAIEPATRKRKVRVVNHKPAETPQDPAGAAQPAPQGEGLAARLRAAGVETARWERNGSKWELTVAEAEHARAGEVLATIAKEHTR